MKHARLEDITINITDGKHGDCDAAENSGYYFVSCKDVRDGSIDYNNARQITEQAFIDTHKRTMLEPNDILVTNSGTIGRMALIKDVPETYRTTFQKSVAIVKPDTSKVVPSYLYYKLQNCVHDFINQSNGSAQKNLLLGTMRNFPIDIHESFQEQEKLASILRNYDELIENNQKQIKLLEEAAQRLYKEWFVDLRFPGHETTPIHDGIPEGWEYKAFSDVFSYIRGRSYSSKELGEKGVLMANLKSIRAFGGYNRNAEKRYEGEFKESQRLVAGDVVMGVTDMTQERRLVGRVAMIPDVKEEMMFSMDLIKLVPSSFVPKAFLYSAMQYGGLSERIAPLANGVNVLHLKPESMMNLKMLVPEKAVLMMFDKAFSAYQGRIEVLQNQSIAATEARDRLLPKLINGEIEV